MKYFPGTFVRVLVSPVKEVPHLDSFVDHANDFSEAVFSSAFYLKLNCAVMFCFKNFDEFLGNSKTFLGTSQTFIMDFFT